MERETDTDTQKGRVRKAGHIPKHRPRNAGKEIQSQILMLYTVGRTELCFATKAQPKPLRGQMEAMRTKIQHVLGGGWATARWGQRSSFMHSLTRHNIYSASTMSHEKRDLPGNNCLNWVIARDPSALLP